MVRQTIANLRSASAAPFLRRSCIFGRWDNGASAPP
nr:MAG TPA: hypothetical protein [Caudoviricetes sp.]